MRLPNDVRLRVLALGLTALLAACGRAGGGDGAEFASVSAEIDRTGPAADYPIVLGEPYRIDGTLYTPVDTLNYDQVGYAVADPQGGTGVTVAHRTLPLPSYVEISELENGKTILARVERRGPMTGNGVVALSAGARAQLGVGANTPVRVRRVNPPEEHRAKLRAGQAAPERIDTPKSLLAVLKRKLSSDGAVSLASNQPSAESVSAPRAGELPPKASVAANPSTAAPVRVAKAPAASDTGTDFQKAFTAERKAVTAYPLAPLDGVPLAAPAPRANRLPAAPAPVTIARTETELPPVTKATEAPEGAFVIQAAAFSSKANAERLANSIDGFVEKSGRFYRVRKGPFASRGQAEAALAKVRAAGYKDAKVFTAG